MSECVTSPKSCVESCVESWGSRTHHKNYKCFWNDTAYMNNTLLRGLYVRVIVLSFTTFFLASFFFFIVPITCHICVGPLLIPASCYQQTFTEDYLFVQLGFFKSTVLMSLSLFYSDMERKCLVTAVNSVGYLITNTHPCTFSLWPFLCSKADH